VLKKALFSTFQNEESNVIDPALRCFNRSYPQGINAELVEAQTAFRPAQGERILKLHKAGSIIIYRYSSVDTYKALDREKSYE